MIRSFSKEWFLAKLEVRDAFIINRLRYDNDDAVAVGSPFWLCPAKPCLSADTA